MNIVYREIEPESENKLQFHKLCNITGLDMGHVYAIILNVLCWVIWTRFWLCFIVKWVIFLPVSRVAGIWPDEEVIFIIINKVNSPKVPYGNSPEDYKSTNHATCFIDCIKAEMSFLSFSWVARRPHDHPLHIAQASLIVTVIRICSRNGNISSLVRILVGRNLPHTPWRCSS